MFSQNLLVSTTLSAVIFLVLEIKKHCLDPHDFDPFCNTGAMAPQTPRLVVAQWETTQSASSHFGASTAIPFCKHVNQTQKY